MQQAYIEKMFDCRFVSQIFFHDNNVQFLIFIAQKSITVGVSRGYTDYYQGRGQAIRPTAALINIHEPLI